MDEVTLDQGTEIQPETPPQTGHCQNTGKPISYPEQICVESYPPATSIIEVHFKLHNTSAVGRKPYCMSRKTKVWLKYGIQRIPDAEIIGPSTSTFASPIAIAPKEDGMLHLCTDYHQTLCCL